MKIPHGRPTAAALTLLSTLYAAWPAAAQQVQVGGQIRQTANRVQKGSAGPLYELRDNASRLSFRGSEDLGGGLRAQFGLEMGYAADTGEQTDPLYRHSYVALAGPWGSLALGRLDSGNPTGSPLYSQVTAITSFAANDAGATAIGTSMLNARNRTSNAIGYRSPSFGGAELMARAYLRGAGTPDEAEDDARSLDLGLLYRSDTWIAGLAVAKDDRAGGLKPNEFDAKWQAGARLSVAAIEPYVLLGQERYEATATTRRQVRFALLGAEWRLGAHTLVLNLMRRDVQASPTGVRRRAQAAWMVALSKRTELQAFADTDGVDSSRSDVRVRAVGAGIKHVF
ncbi:MAG: porin [Piscinibacter sp.]|uniref:porin n=1 Tax=Piscinibacter sp. TaxID=1903157 RepID=UPI002587DC09|nr:porin [Piscinibacter sp.]MCW5665264.1 porin [Piscinibacter sp.]